MLMSCWHNKFPVSLYSPAARSQCIFPSRLTIFFLSHTNCLSCSSLLSGPGNNGGDGLVAARHLGHLGHNVTVLYPRPGSNPFFTQLCTQCANLDIAVLETLPVADDGGGEYKGYDLVIDAMFGFSFKGPAKEPYESLLRALAEVGGAAAGEGMPAVLSVDVPSG